MSIQIVRAAVAVTIIVLGMMTPLLISLSDRVGSDAVTAILGRRPGDTAYAQDDNEEDDEDDDNEEDEDEDEDNEDEEEDDENDDEDEDDDNEDEEEDDENDDEDEDNEDDEDGENDDEDDDNEDDDEDDDNEDDEDDDDNEDDDGDNVTGGGTAPFADPGPIFDPTVLQASGVTTGGDGFVALPGDRIVVRYFTGMPQGVTVSIQLLNKASFPSAAGAPVIALIYQIEARNPAGVPQVALPVEVNVSARYMNSEVAGLNKARATLLWFNPATSQWGPAPKLIVDPTFNYVGSSTTGLGYYCVCVP